MNEFNLQEAVSLIYCHAVRRNSVPDHERPTDITQIGHVCGVLTLNDQIELVIKFHDSLCQYTKEEFHSEIRLIDQKQY